MGPGRKPWRQVFSQRGSYYGCMSIDKHLLSIFLEIVGRYFDTADLDYDPMRCKRMVGYGGHFIAKSHYP